MALRIFNNVNSVRAQRRLGTNTEKFGIAISKIASGLRINKSSDDAAGLAVSERLRSDTRTLRQGAKNLNDGIALINTVEGALSAQASALIRLRELASQAATGTIGASERQADQLEFNSLRQEISRIAMTTEFNGQALLNGQLAAGAANKIVIQIGLNSQQANRLDLNREIDIGSTTSFNLGIGALSVTNPTSAINALDTLFKFIVICLNLMVTH